MCLIIGKQNRADEEKHQSHRHVEQRAHPDRAAGGFFGVGRVVALHEILVNAEVGQVDENAVQQHHPDGGAGEAQAHVAKAEFFCLVRERECLPCSLRHAGEDQHHHENRPQRENDALDGIGPDDRLDAAEQGVKRHRYARNDDDRFQLPAGQRAQAHGHAEHDRADARDLREQIAGDCVHARPWAKPFFEMLVGGKAGILTVKRHKPFDRDVS